MKTRSFVIVMFAMFFAAGPARGQHKGDFTLFHPTPQALMRDLSTDRPDVTESPRTVDAGHFQLEMSFIEFVRENDAEDVEEFTVLPFNFKVGVLNNVDVQLVYDPYVRREFDESDDASGNGNAQVRTKINLWGNDEGGTALAVMPFIQLPVADDEIDDSDDHLEGGIIVPFSVDLTERATLSVMGELDFLNNPDEDEYDVELVHTASLGVGVTETLGAYFEYVGIVPFDDADDYAATVGTGATLQLSENVQLDAGVYVGLTEEAEDFRALTGISVRL